jgi:hypothetical protein
MYLSDISQVEVDFNVDGEIFTKIYNLPLDLEIKKPIFNFGLLGKEKEKQFFKLEVNKKGNYIIFNTKRFFELRVLINKPNQTDLIEKEIKISYFNEFSQTKKILVGNFFIENNNKEIGAVEIDLQYSDLNCFSWYENINNPENFLLVIACGEQISEIEY